MEAYPLQVVQPSIPVPVAASANAAPQGRIQELDGWRAVSVVLVILHHLFSIQHPAAVVRFHWLWHIFGMSGFLGVDTFFVISGFVICRLLTLEESRNGSVSIRSFYIRRAFRILPPLYLYLASTAALVAAGMIHEQWISFAVAGSFLYDLNFMPPSWIFAHIWSLSVEEQFYLVFPTVWLLTRNNLRGLLFSGVFLVCALWNLLLLSQQYPVVDGRTRVGFACISCGVWIALHEEKVRRYAAHVPLGIIALLGFVLLVHPVPHGALLEVLYSSLFVPPAIGLVLMSSLERRSYVRSFLRHKAVQAVGLSSYGIYLWQQLFTGPREVYSGSGAFLPRSIWLLPLLVALSYFLVEKPTMRFGRSLSRRLYERTRDK